MVKPFKNAVQMSHMLVKQVVEATDTVIDATCGNGNDTLFLADLVRKGQVFAFDIANEAVEQTEELLAEHSLLAGVTIFKDSHANIPQYIKGPVKAVMFNLGYLPGSRSSITSPAETVKALKACLPLLAEGGMVTIVCYTGHPGGIQETDMVTGYVSALTQQEFAVQKMKFLNQINNPPELLVVQKI